MKKIRLKDVADMLGVSVVTVSNALSGKKGVSDNLRKKIIKTAHELGINCERYSKCNNSSNNVGTETEGLILGVLVSDFYVSIGTSFYWEMYQKITYAATRARCLTSLDIVKEKSGNPKVPNMIKDNSIDGLIILGMLKREFLDEVLNACQCPIVSVDFTIPEKKISAVLSSNYLGMYKATRELIKAGHKRIGFVGTMGFSHNIGERLCGFQKCMIENGLSVPLQWIFSDRVGEMETAYVSLPDELPTAFACSSDYAASILYDALERRGLSVPNDISIASYDNYLYNHKLSGKLTTYNVDMEAIAESAIHRIIMELRYPELAGKTEYIDSNVIRRTSIKNIE